MLLGSKIGAVARKLNRLFGLVAWLSGDPVPPAGGFDLDGEKLIDWAWVCTNLPPGQKKALEIGPGKSPIIPAMLSLGYDVTAIDASMDASNVISGFRFIRGDFQDFNAESEFDIIVLCSVVEHIGLSGRYNSKENPDGDLHAMRKVRSMLVQGGQVFLTIPVGSDAIHRPWHRVYGEERLPRLVNGFELVRARYFNKQPYGPWYETSQDKALEFPVDIRRYCLGQMILQKPCNGGLQRGTKGCERDSANELMGKKWTTT